MEKYKVAKYIAVQRSDERLRIAVQRGRGIVGLWAALLGVPALLYIYFISELYTAARNGLPLNVFDTETGIYALWVTLIWLPVWWHLLFYEKTICTVTSEKLTARNRLIPLFERRTIPADAIKQLFDLEGRTFYSKTFYYIYIETWTGQQIKIVPELPTLESAQEIENLIESFLGIEDKPGQAELGEKRFRSELDKAWEILADANNLQLERDISPAVVQRINGLYRGGQLNLSAGYDQRMKPFTCLSLANPNHSPHSPEVRPQLTEAGLNRLLDPAQVRFRLGGDWSKEGADWVINAERVVYCIAGIEADSEHLQFLMDTLIDLWRLYPQIMDWPQKAMPVLQNVASNDIHPSQSLARRILNDLAETTQPLQEQLPDLVCQYCLHRFTNHKASKTITYVGCRLCHRTRPYFPAQGVVAVLDEAMEEQHTLTEQTLRINTLSRQELFDFDEVDIGQATDEAVERFMVRIGNDTEPLRVARYTKMKCTLTSNHSLSENTLRILKQKFKLVIIEVSNRRHMKRSSNP